MVRSSLLALAFLSVFAAPALAHRVFIAFAARENHIEIEAFYEDDTPAYTAKVKVVDDDGTTVAEGMTDAKGLWTFPAPKPGTYVVHLDAGAGHRLKKKLTVPLMETKSDVPPSANEVPTPSENSSVETRDEQTRTPWARIGLGLAFIGGASGTLLLVSRMRQSRRTPEPEA
ncbi:MAG: carboxypeptidase regulatory-like domain-containing protein [Gemmataceae bacterium]|nr:carboxypeptidase regulatory-like domain-containing protein [Gemmataceae bacterium]